MSIANNKLIPAAFWVGFLLLGFATSLGGPDKHRPAHASQTQTLVAESEKPAPAKTSAATPAQD
jgi:hypothetical protein